MTAIAKIDSSAKSIYSKQLELQLGAEPRAKRSVQGVHEHWRMGEGNNAEAASAKSILIVSPAWVGDLIMSQVLFKLLKQQNPKTVIDVLAPAWGRSLLIRMPEVNQIYEMPFTHGQFKLRQRWQLGRSLRSSYYTQAIVLPNSWKSALIPFAAKIPIRTGWLGEFRWGILNDIRLLDKSILPLMIQRFAALGLPANVTIPLELPKPKLELSQEKIFSTLAKFNLNNNKSILVLCPGAEYGPAKRWPTAYYGEVAKQKISEGWQVWIMGSNKDQPLALEIQKIAANACIDLTGQTSLGEAIDLLSQAKLVITNDSGLMHVTAALQRPMIAIYGSSSPKFTPPLSDHVKILSLNLACSPCFQRECPLKHFKCLRELSPKTVLQSVDELLTEHAILQSGFTVST